MFSRKTTQILTASLVLIASACDSDPKGLTDPPLSSFLLTNTESVQIEPGDTRTITATKNGAVVTGATWTSGNNAVATVSSAGVITAVAPGATWVKVESSGESRYVSVNVPTLQGTQVFSGTPVTGLASSAARGSIALYRIFIPDGTTNLTVTISGGTGDVDLYVRQGTPPTTTSARNCASENGGNGELCSINPSAGATQLTKGTWYIGLGLWDPYTGATLTATKTP